MCIGIIVEGQDDKEVLEEIFCSKLKLKGKIRISEIKGKILNTVEVDKRANMLKNHFTHFVRSKLFYCRCTL